MKSTPFFVGHMPWSAIFGFLVLVFVILPAHALMRLVRKIRHPFCN